MLDTLPKSSLLNTQTSNTNQLNNELHVDSDSSLSSLMDSKCQNISDTISSAQLQLPQIHTITISTEEKEFAENHKKRKGEAFTDQFENANLNKRISPSASLCSSPALTYSTLQPSITSSINNQSIPSIRSHFFTSSPKQLAREQEAIDALFDMDCNECGEGDFKAMLYQLTGLSNYCFDALHAKFQKIKPGRWQGGCTKEGVTKYYEACLKNKEPVERLFLLLKANDSVNYLVRDDFTVLLEDIIRNHPGLEFLQSAAEFQSTYAETVISRIFYEVNKNGDEKMTLSQLRNSNFLEILNSLDMESDINAVRPYFSYEHFFTMYCAFWSLDTDHDGLIDFEDLLHYENGWMNKHVIQRVINGFGRMNGQTSGTMNYREFIVFLLSEVDKTTPQAIRYWFNVLDTDHDGVLSLFELEQFYTDQNEKMMQKFGESIQFNNLLCQIFDMLTTSSKLTTSAIDNHANDKLSNFHFTYQDLVHNELTSYFLNSIINVQKFEQQERKDTAAVRFRKEFTHLTEWEKYVLQVYPILANKADSENELIEERLRDEEESSSPIIISSSIGVFDKSSDELELEQLIVETQKEVNEKKHLLQQQQRNEQHQHDHQLESSIQSSQQHLSSPASSSCSFDILSVDDSSSDDETPTLIEQNDNNDNINENDESIEMNEEISPTNSPTHSNASTDTESADEH